MPLVLERQITNVEACAGAVGCSHVPHCVQIPLLVVCEPNLLLTLQGELRPAKRTKAGVKAAWTSEELPRDAAPAQGPVRELPAAPVAHPASQVPRAYLFIQLSLEVHAFA